MDTHDPAATPGDLSDSVATGEPPAGSLGRRNERLLVIGVVGYSALVILLMFLRGIEITPDVMAVAFGLAAVLLGRGRLFLRDWLPFVALFLAYELMRGLADDVGFPVHTTTMVAAEHLLLFGQVATQLLQDAFRPASGVDHLAWLATIVYMLHFALPLATGFVLWVWRRAHYYDYVAALILLSLWAFVTFVVMPTAPPWYAAQVGDLNGPTGQATIAYLKPGAFEQLATFFGFKADYLYTYTFYDVNPNGFAAWPSLHVAYPILSFLVLRRAFGKVAWLAFGYAVLVAFSVLYTGDHWLIDCLGGAAYAYVAYYAIVHGPARVQRLLAGLRDDTLVGRAGGGLRASVIGLRTSVAWVRLGLGAIFVIVGWDQVLAMEHAGQTGTWLYLLPWLVLFSGLWVVAVAIIRR